MQDDLRDSDATVAGAGGSGTFCLLRRERQGAIAILTLARPNQRNALSVAMLDALTAAIADVSSDASISAVVLAAEGPAFCAGHDLKELTARRADGDKGRAFFADTMQRCAATMQAILASPKPFIAAVEGPASAAGCQLVATCDLAVAGRAATFATPGVNIGLFCSTPMVALSRNVSPKHAMEMLLLGEAADAKRAAAIGLVNRVVDAGTARAAAITLAERVASKSPLTVAVGKRAFYAQADMTIAEAYAYTAEVMVHNMLARDAEEGISAFIERREPKWDGT